MLDKSLCGLTMCKINVNVLFTINLQSVWWRLTSILQVKDCSLTFHNNNEKSSSLLLAESVGEDIQSAGEAIEEGAEDASN